VLTCGLRNVERRLTDWDDALFGKGTRIPDYLLSFGFLPSRDLIGENATKS